MLFPVSLPSRGGDTQYVNMHQAYDDLSAATEERIDGLEAVHVYLSKYSPRELRPLSEDSARQGRRRGSIRWSARIPKTAARRFI